MANNNKIKGTKYERKIVEKHVAEGVPAKRVPLSGALKDYPGDVTIGETKDRMLRGEVKARAKANGFKVCREWLGDNDVLFLQETQIGPKGNPPVFVMLQWDVYMKLLKAWMDS